MNTTAPEARTTVLIVEDEGIIAGNIWELLLGLGYEPLAIAASSEEAVACAAERCPDVVLMDIRLKGKVDGIATAEVLKERFDVPIIYLTAHADDATIERAKVTEPFGYLMKPVKPSEVRVAIEVARYKHAMDRRLRARERWLSTAMRSIGDAVVMVDLAGKITFLNPCAESLLGLTQGEALGKPARDVVRLRGNAWSAEDSPLDYALRERQILRVEEAVLETSSGASRLITDSSSPVIDADELLGAVMVFRDVTEQKQLQRQLEVADRLSSLGTMAAGVAHEINNPLAVVIGNAEILLEHLRRAGSPHPAGAPRAGRLTDEDALDAQRDLLSAANRIARIVADLRAFSRPAPKASGSADVRDAVEWAVRSTAHEFRHRARLSTQLEDNPRVAGDETRLGQVLVNLLLNAAQSITPGDAAVNQVTVTARGDGEGSVLIEVTDTGSGIAPEALGRIFDPYYTSKPVGVGTGLGLSICHGLVTSMGGKISVRSRLGEGTTFSVRLPASVQRESTPLFAPAPAVEELRGRILLIDDEEMVRKAVRLILGDHDVASFESAREALATLDQDQGFDIILCDLMMPNMTGMEFYERLLRSRPEVARRVVFMTGGSMTSKGEQFLSVVDNLCIEKPFSMVSLRATIQRILSERRRGRCGAAVG